MFIYITTQELTHLFILTQEELFSKIREKSEYSHQNYERIGRKNRENETIFFTSGQAGTSLG